ncbi:MAG: NUDIX hydrolase [Flavobacteriaceae bacterium]
MDELVDILNEEGGYTGNQLMKSEAHRKGLFHPTVHIWLYTRNGRIRSQQRGRTKKSFPLLWDVSVAGHVEAGEEIAIAALRETKEEIGLSLEQQDLVKIGIFKSQQIHNEDFKDFEFHHCFIAELKIPVDKLKRQKSEVEEIKLIPLLNFAEEVWGLGNPSKYVPHGTYYYKEIVKAINNSLKRSDKFSGLA